MARTVYEHVLKLTGENTNLVRAADGSAKALKRLDESSRMGQKSLDRYNRSVQVATNSSSAFANAFGGISIALLARELIQASDSMILLEGRLRLVTSGTDDLISTQKELFQVAQDSRASLEATTSFYVRLAQRLGDVSTGSLELSEITELVSKSLKIGGATAKETSSSLLQLSQALSSGLLRGDEFRSLSENAVGLMQNIADGAGLTQAQLRELSIQGRLTTELILDALQKSAPQIRSQFEQIPVTFGDAIQRLQNVAVQGIADLNSEFGATEKIVDAISLLADNIDLVAIAFGNLAALKVRSVILSQVEAFQQSAAAAKQAQLAAEQKIISDKRVVAEAFRVADAELKKQQAIVSGLTTQRAAITAEIARERALIKTNAATFGLSRGTERLNALQAQGLAITKQVTVAKEGLAAATARAATASAALGNQWERTATKARGLGAAVSFLGGPLGIGLLLLQGGLLVSSLGLLNDEIELTEDSLRLLGNRTSELTDKNYEELLAREKQLVKELEWIKELDRGTEAAEQRKGILEKLIEKVRELKGETEEGREADEEALRVRVSQLKIEEGRLASLSRAQGISQAAIGTSSQLKRVRRELAEAEDELAIAQKASSDAFNQGIINYKAAATQNEKDIQAKRILVRGLKDEVSERQALVTERTRLLEIQKEGFEGLRVEGEAAKVLADRIEKLNEQIDGRKKKTGEQLTASEKLVKRENELVAKIKELTAAHVAAGTETSIFSVELLRAEEALAKLRGELSPAEQEVKDLTDAYERNEISVAELERSLFELGLTQEQVNKIFGDTLSATDRIRGSLEELNQEYRDKIAIQRIEITSGKDAAALYERLAKLGREYGLSVEEIAQAMPELVAEQQRLIEQEEGLKRLNGYIQEFSDGLADLIVNGGDVEEYFKDLWKRMAADFIASGLTQLIGSLFGGGGLDFSGFNPANFFGAGGNNSSNPLADLGGKFLQDQAQSAALEQLTGTALGNALGLGGGAGTLVGNGINSLFGGEVGSTIVGNGINNLASALGLGPATSGGVFGPAATFIGPPAPLVGPPAPSVAFGGNLGGGGFNLGTAGSIAGAALGAYNVYQGLDQGGSAGIGRAVGGGATILGSLGIAGGPVTAIAGLVLSTLLAGRGARDYDQILAEDYLPDLLGVNAGSAAGNNSAVFGANFGVQGSGLTAQFLADGGANGNGGFFTGAQSSLDGFEAALRAAGFDELINNEGGVLRVFDKDKNVEDIMAIWEAYSSGLEDAVAYNEVFKTAVENGLIQPSNLFFEQFALGFGQSYEEAKASLGQIDESFDKFVDNGMSSSEALFQSISEHYGIAVEDAQYFVEQSGVSLDQWVNNFSVASGENLQTLFNFNDDGLTMFENTFATIDDLGKDTAGTLGDTFGQLNSEITQSVQRTIDAYRRGLRSLDGALDDVNVGSLGSGGLNVPTLGAFSSAMTGSETVMPSQAGVQDRLYTIGVNAQESVTVNRKGMIEDLSRQVNNIAATIDGNRQTEGLIRAVEKLTREIALERAASNVRR